MRRRTLFKSCAACAAAAMLPTTLVAAESTIRLADLYNDDMSFSEQALRLEGDRVTVEGYMAPPLKAQSNFYVLTLVPMAVCPFCDDEAQWPDDILAIYAQRVVTVLPYYWRIEARGRLALGTYTDPELGFVSRVRLVDAAQNPV